MNFFNPRFWPFILITMTTISSFGMQDDPNKDLVSAVKAHSPYWIEAALLQGANINHMIPISKKPYTLLQIFVHNEQIVKILLQHGAESQLCVIDEHGETPLHIAVSNPHSANIVQMFLNYGATKYINTPNNAGLTPLHIAACNVNFKITKILLGNGARASINQPDNNGFTPLHNAIISRHPDTVQILLNQGADISMPIAWELVASDYKRQPFSNSMVTVLNSHLEKLAAQEKAHKQAQIALQEKATQERRDAQQRQKNSKHPFQSAYFTSLFADEPNPKDTDHEVYAQKQDPGNSANIQKKHKKKSSLHKKPNREIASQKPHASSSLDFLDNIPNCTIC